MKGQNLNQEVIDTRGRLYCKNPSYAICVADKKSSTFKTLVGLADEAATAKERLSHTVATGHPLGSTLAGMNCAEAISSLLAFTAAYLGASMQAKVGGEIREQVLPSEIHTVQASKRADAEAQSQKPTLLDDALVLDDESFDAFANFPGTQR